jgi:hypothetical protein
MTRPSSNSGNGSCCAQCGGKKFALKGAASDDTPVTCLDCGSTFGPWKTIRAGMLDSVASQPTKGRIAGPAIARKATAT